MIPSSYSFTTSPPATYPGHHVTPYNLPWRSRHLLQPTLDIMPPPATYSGHHVTSCYLPWASRHPLQPTLDIMSPPATYPGHHVTPCNLPWTSCSHWIHCSEAVQLHLVYRASLRCAGGCSHATITTKQHEIIMKFTAISLNSHQHHHQ